MPTVFFTYLAAGLLMIAMPVGLGIFLARRWHIGWRIWWIGAAVFVLSQVGHIPFNSFVLNPLIRQVSPLAGAALSSLVTALLLGLSAGLFEELGNAAAMKWWAKDVRSWRKGVMLGAGHGGIEAIIFGGLLLVNVIYFASIRSVDLSTIVPAEQLGLAQQQIDAFWNASIGTSLLPALERALTIPAHIAFAVLVLQAFTRRRWYWVALAVLWHTALDCAAVYFGILWQGQPWSAIALEGVVAIFTAISIILIFALRQPEPEPAAAPRAEVPAPLPITPETVQLETTPEDIERSRYSPQ